MEVTDNPRSCRILLFYAYDIKIMGTVLWILSEHPADSSRDGLRQILEFGFTALDAMPVAGIHKEVMAADGKSHSTADIPAQLGNVLALVAIAKVVCHLIHVEDDILHGKARLYIRTDLALGNKPPSHAQP